MGTTGLVVILFTDVVASTEVLSRVGEERSDELRQAHFALLREAITAHAGTEVKNLGDGLMVAFEAASDAVSCAVAMQQSVAQHGRRADEALAMRVGIAVGEATREGADFFGTPVVEASRLCGQADGGQILVTEITRVLAGARSGHVFEPFGALELKGLAAPVSVCAVRWKPIPDVGAPLPPRLSMSPPLQFIGRDRERRRLAQAWKAAEQGTIQVVLVAGEPGIGKTRLATEVALDAHRDGGLVLVGTCDEDVALPYQPFVEALDHLVAVCPDDVLAEGLAERGGELTRVLPDLSRRVATLPPPQEGDPDSERYLLFCAVGRLLATVAGWRPVLLILDDLHWATKPSLLLLKHLIRSAEPMPVLIVGTYRDSEISRGHPLMELLAELRREGRADRISLRGLSDDEAVTMMEILAGHDLAGSELALAHAVHAEADGSPFFMRELLRHLIEAGELVRVNERWTFRGELTEIPDSVREVIGCRLSRLSDGADRLLTLAAVIGREFDVAVLAPIAALDASAVAEALAEARRAALVEETERTPGRFAFVHALIRHTIYDDLGPTRRMQIHRRVAETLECLADGDRYLSDLAHHWVAATPATGVAAADLAKAARYAEQAGQRAAVSLAYEEAARHFEGAAHAAQLAGSRADTVRLLTALGEAQRCAGDPAHRETLLEAGRLAFELGDVEHLARAALANQRGVFSRVGAVDGDRVAALERALGMVGPVVTATRASLLAALATELHYEGEERRLAFARQAVDIARQLNRPETLAQALAALWFAAWGSTVEAERRAIAAELQQVAEQSGEPNLMFQARSVLFLTASAAGDMELADQALLSCVHVAEGLGQPVLRWRVAYLHAHRAMAAGRFDEVERWANQTRTIGEETAQPDREAFATFPLVVRMLQGRPGETVEVFRSLVESFPGASVYPAVLAWALAEHGQMDEARGIVDDFRSRGFADMRDYMRLVGLVSLARAASRLEDLDAAAVLHDLVLPFRHTMTTSQASWLGPVGHDLGLLATVLGRYEEAEAHFAGAVEIQDRIQARGTVLHSRLEWARLLLRRGHPGDISRARILLEEARADAHHVGVPAVEARIDQLHANLPD